MTARKKIRTQSCTAADARRRQAQARSFLEVAELVADEKDLSLEYGGVAASLAVLAGIAASDAACCKALRERSRSDNHHDAEALLGMIPAGGSKAATDLRGLIGLKDRAHYGFITVTPAQLKRALREARRTIAFSDEVLNR